MPVYSSRLIVESLSDKSLEKRVRGFMLLILMKVIEWTTKNQHPKFIGKSSATGNFVKLFSGRCTGSFIVDGRH